MIIPSSASSFDPVRPDKDTWTCYDHSIDYANNHDEWEVLTISHHRYFQGQSHMVNYRIEGNTMYIHDELYDIDMVYHNFKHAPEFFHFWNSDEIPKRNYYYLIDNRDVVINEV